MKLLRSKTLALFVLIVLVILSIPANWYFRSRRLSRAYLVIQLGDSKQSVIERLGQPTDMGTCYHPEDESESQKKCSEVLRYFSILEEWDFSFDLEGRLI